MVGLVSLESDRIACGFGKSGLVGNKCKVDLNIDVGINMNNQPQMKGLGSISDTITAS